MKTDISYSVTRIGDSIAIHADRWNGDSLLTSKQIAQLSIDQADALVRHLSEAIHERPAKEAV